MNSVPSDLLPRDNCVSEQALYGNARCELEVRQKWYKQAEVHLLEKGNIEPAESKLGMGHFFKPISANR